MKKSIFYTFIVFVTFSLFPHYIFAQIHSVDDLIQGFACADEPSSKQYVYDFAIYNPQMTKSLLLLQDRPFAKVERAKKNAFNCFKISSHMGLITKEEFFDVAFSMIADIDRYHNEYGRESALAWYRGGVAHYDLGSVIKDANFSDLILMLNSLQNNNHFRNKGIKNSIEQKLNNAFKAFKKGNANAAISLLNATKNEIEAQSGKGINQQIALTLESYIDNLVAGIEKL
jgi:hypothetical protein